MENTRKSSPANHHPAVRSCESRFRVQLSHLLMRNPNFFRRRGAGTHQLAAARKSFQTDLLGNVCEAALPFIQNCIWITCLCLLCFLLPFEKVDRAANLLTRSCPSNGL